MNIKGVITSQYMAALEMLAQAITQCPAQLWAYSIDQNQFWHVAYHALFYTHLYLQPTEDDFRPWEKHLAGLQSFLELRTPLPESYRTFEFTGQRGDRSERIRTGRILSDLPSRHLELEPRVLERVREAHSRCTRVLAECCRAI